MLVFLAWQKCHPLKNQRKREVSGCHRCCSSTVVQQRCLSFTISTSFPIFLENTLPRWSKIYVIFSKLSINNTTTYAYNHCIISLHSSKKKSKLVMLTHTCHPSIWEAEAAGSQVPGQPDYTPRLRKKEKRERKGKRKKETKAKSCKANTFLPTILSSTM